MSQTEMISPFKLNGGIKISKLHYCTECNYNVFLENVVLIFIVFSSKWTLLMGATLFTHLTSRVFFLLTNSPLFSKRYE